MISSIFRLAIAQQSGASNDGSLMELKRETLTDNQNGHFALQMISPHQYRHSALDLVNPYQYGHSALQMVNPIQYGHSALDLAFHIKMVNPCLM